MHLGARVAFAVTLTAPALALADDAPPGAPADPYGQPSPQPQPQPQPYPYYYPPQPVPPPGPPKQDNGGKLELVADFAGLGLLATISLMVYRDYDDPGTGTLLVMGGALGGGGLGWMIGDKLDVTRGEANAGTLGMALGFANGALLLVPAHQTDSGSEILGTLLLGGTVGITAGLGLGRNLDMTRGQGTFAANLSLLGIGTSLIVGALIDDDDGDVDPAEMVSLAVGLDGGAAAGLVLGQKIEWSYRRARFVLAASAVGTFLGAMIGGLIATDKEEDGTTTTDPDLTAGSLLVGMWGGFAGGIALTKDWAPDPKYAGTPAAPAPSTPGGVTARPMVGNDTIGLMAAGAF